MSETSAVFVDDRSGGALASALADAGVGGASDAAAGLVLVATSSGDWSAARATLDVAFARSQEAAANRSPVVYVVHHDDLLGRRGAPAAMMATGLLSAARTLAVEGSRRRVPVNVVAVDDATEPADAARWAVRLLEPGGPIGDVVRLGSSHLGKALP